MCIGLPMQVIHAQPGRATVVGRGSQRQVNTVLVGDLVPGDWVLVFIDGVRERLSAERAAEVNATLDLIDAALAGTPPTAPGALQPLVDPGFTLPSAMSAAQLAALAGGPADTGTAGAAHATPAATP